MYNGFKMVPLYYFEVYLSPCRSLKSPSTSSTSWVGVAKNQAKALATAVNQVAGVAGERYHLFRKFHRMLIIEAKFEIKLIIFC